MEPGITWYDVLGVLPDAEARTIKRTYDDRLASAAAPAEQARRHPGRPRAVLSRVPGGGGTLRACRQGRSAHGAPDGGRRAGGRSGS